MSRSSYVSGHRADAWTARFSVPCRRRAAAVYPRPVPPALLEKQQELAVLTRLKTAVLALEERAARLADGGDIMADGGDGAFNGSTAAGSDQWMSRADMTASPLVVAGLLSRRSHACALRLGSCSYRQRLVQLVPDLSYRPRRRSVASRCVSHARKLPARLTTDCTDRPPARTSPEGRQPHLVLGRPARPPRPGRV
jgi:hypothetical protein